MSYANFIPNVWNETIERELERLCVFAEDCNRKYEGAVSKKGESVTILGVGKPTIKRIARSAANATIDGPEEIEDTSTILYINQIAYFNYMVGDVDKAQAVDGVMDALQAETSEGLANDVDKYIASFATDPTVTKLFGNSAPTLTATEGETGKTYVLDALDMAIQKLQENDVSTNTKVVVTVSPRFFRLFKRAYIKQDTDNSEMMKNGKVAMYGNVIVKMSNNVAKTGTNSDTDNIMIRTQRAIAYVQPLTHTEPYRPENRFADAVKGFILFDAKVVRPKEIVNINVKYA